ncbi:MAG: TIM barrel protein [Eubacteriales bacterium]
MESNRKSPWFGPAGNSESFYAAGFKRTVDAPAFLASLGLNAYEYQGGSGITAGEATLREIGAAAATRGIHLSLHAPYYISLSGVEPDKRLKSIDYIEKSLWAAKLLGARVIVVHTGSAAKISREEAMALAADTLCQTLAKLDTGGVSIGLETMGKVNQLGTLDEVLKLCVIDPRLVPVVDFGHMHAREGGTAFLDGDDYRRVFDRIGSQLGDSVARNLHCHFSRLEWTGAGEKRHLTFADKTYGPDFEPLMETICRENLTPTIICESAGSMAEDALAMKTYYERIAAV